MDDRSFSGIAKEINIKGASDGDFFIEYEGDHVVVGTIEELIDYPGGDDFGPTGTGKPTGQFISHEMIIYYFNNDADMVALGERFGLAGSKSIYAPPGDYKRMEKKAEAWRKRYYNED